MEASGDGPVHPHAVSLKVVWPTTEHEHLLGDDSETHEVHLKVLPEINLPKPISPGHTCHEWEQTHAADLFWLVKRQAQPSDVCNCEIMYRNIIPMFAAGPEPSGSWKPQSFTSTFTVSLPFIVNKERIEADSDVILRWQVLDKPPPKSQSGKTWVNVLQESEKKRLRKSTK